MDEQTEYTTVKALAEEFGLDKSNMRKWLKNQNFTFIQVRDPISCQLMIALTREDAELAKEMRRSQGYLGSHKPVVDLGKGFFYIIQIMPDLVPERVKLGYATDCQSRLQSYLTVSPTARLLHCWPCASVWEQTAIASLTRMGCRRVGGEVFDCDCLEALIDRGDSFFSLLPDNK